MLRSIVSSFKFRNRYCNKLWLAILLAGSISSAFVFSNEIEADSLTSYQQQAQGSQEVTTLELGKPITREITGGQQQAYQIALAQYQYASITVEQLGIDVAVRVLGEKENPIAQFDFEIRSRGHEPVELVAESAGNYRVVIEGKGTKAFTGQYEIQLTEIRVATEKDRSLQEARKLATESASLFRAGKYDHAIPLGERALEIRERLLGPDHPEVAVVLNNLALVYRNKSDFDKAENLHQRALKIMEKSLGAEHPNVAMSLNGLANLYVEKGDYDGAEPLYKTVVSIFERSFGPEHPQTATSLNNLGNVYLNRGEFDRAEPLYKRALEIREKFLGPEHPQVATSLYNLANTYQYKGDFDRSEQLYQRALTIMEKSLGPKHPNVAHSLNSLANVYFKRGDLEKAESLYDRALKIWEETLGPEDASVAYSLHNIALIYRTRGDLDKAESLYKRALEIRMKSRGQWHQETGHSINNLASIYLNRGDLEKAESLYKQTLSIWEKSLGPESPTIANVLSNLAILYRYKGDFAEAERLHQRALTISEKALGSEHPTVATFLNEMAIFYVTKGEFAKAVAAQSRANAINERNVALNLVTGSERQKLAYLASLSDITDRTLSLHIRSAPDDAEACGLAATTILQRKGRVLDAMADSLTTLRQRFSEQDQKLLDQLNGNLSRLAKLVLDGPQQITIEEHQKRIKTLEEQREELETEISRRSAGYYRPSQPVALSQVQSMIPAKAALIEFAIYRPFNPKAAVGTDSLGEPRYVAYIIHNQGEVRWVELGATREIDKAIDALRQSLRDPRRKDVTQQARTVDERIMQPVRALTGDASQLLISPDGALNLIPFEALIDEHGHFLVERFSFTYLTSGRDLLRLQIARASKSAPVVLANPMFGEPDYVAIAKPEGSKAGRAMSVNKSQREAKRQSITTGSDLSNVYFTSLSGTAQEGQVIKSLFAEASLLTGSQATETLLKRVAAPRLLHVATHGFFLTDEPQPPNSGLQGTRAISASAKVANPLLRSGLALAGANIHKSGDDDGIMTALEASGLNLWGTKLVTLSACDTGIGEVKNGEGVYGLRRAFVLAGTETLVMSMWPVSDYITRELMTAYYKGLKEGHGRGESLRQVQLSMLKRKGREHPFYWASFIQSGEWANLDGKR